MAMIETNGLDELVLDMATIAALPGEVVDRMLMAGGDVIANGHRQEIDALGLVDGGQLKKSIQVLKKISRSADMRYVLVYPQGKHHTYHARSGGERDATSGDVGFVHEFGGHGNAAQGWMRNANEKHIEEAVEQEMSIYDQFLKSNRL